MDQPGKVANPARGQLNKENEYSPVPVRAWEFGIDIRSIYIYTACVVRKSQVQYVCMYVCMVITYSRECINRVRWPILLVVS